jgi:DNA-binding NarL/FixJ family response regulator
MQHISLVAALSNAKFREALRNQIAQQGEIQLVGDAEHARQILHAVSHAQPDVLLLEAALCNATGACAESPLLAAIHHDSPGTKVLLLGDHCGQGTEPWLAHALRDGARGCIDASVAAEDCLRAIHAVNDGEVWIGRRELASVIDDLLKQLERADDTSARLTAALSQRELEIAEAVTVGLSNKEIARKLKISPTTVKSHLENIFQKLHVSHRVQLAILARSPASPPG